jgi:hypothetical protein
MAGHVFQKMLNDARESSGLDAIKKEIDDKLGLGGPPTLPTLPARPKRPKLSKERLALDGLRDVQVCSCHPGDLNEAQACANKTMRRMLLSLEPVGLAVMAEGIEVEFPDDLWAGVSRAKEVRFPAVILGHSDRVTLLAPLDGDEGRRVVGAYKLTPIPALVTPLFWAPHCGVAGQIVAMYWARSGGPAFAPTRVGIPVSP